MISLRLTIENQSALPDGGPLFYTLTGRRGIDIGRDPHLDWVLPDPTRVVSGKHCEIRFREGGYWLHDVSSNGTFLNGNASRLAEPRRLRQGDRLEIGPYLIGVALTGEAQDEPRDAPTAFVSASPPPRPVSGDPSGDLWGADGEVAPPARVDRARGRRPLHDVDFMDSAGDIPSPSSPFSSSPPAQPELDWAAPLPRRKGAISGAISGATLPEGIAPEMVPAPMPLPSPVSASASTPEYGPVVADLAQFVALFERGAGLPPGSLKARAPEELAETLGRMMILVTAELKLLMQARTESKAAMRSASHTSVQALDNNPIPFAPTPEDALRIMLAEPGRSYLSGDAALRKTFEALKSHQMETFVAMQAALDGLLRELDPAEIERSTEPDGAVGNLFGARKARLWESYRTRWQTLAATHADGIRGAFMSLFTARYDRGSGKK